MFNKFLNAFIAVIMIGNSALAQDMSRTEKYEEAYKSNPDGSSLYVGACSLHEDYKNKKFRVLKTLVSYFEPSRDLREFNQKMKNIDPELLRVAVKQTALDSLSDADDITIEKITSRLNPRLDLYRLNIGVGGGNGMFLIYKRSTRAGASLFELMTHTFDGDIEYCDQEVWSKR